MTITHSPDAYRRAAEKYRHRAQVWRKELDTRDDLNPQRRASLERGIAGQEQAAARHDKLAEQAEKETGNE